jgi:type IV pilus assembly protein PilC
MPNFVYQARDENGASTNGVVNAKSPVEATRLLRAQGKYPTSIRVAGDSQAHSAHEQSPRRPGLRISRTELIQLSNQLSIMAETGVTLSEALESISQQELRPNAVALVRDLLTQVQSGSDFSAALARHPRSFPRLYIALIRASEKSGMLAKMLMRATAYVRDEAEVLRRVRGALTYPAIMLGFAVTTTVFLLAFVLPRFTAIYASRGAALPAPTRVLMAISACVTGHWAILLFAAIAAYVLGYLFLGSPFGRRCWHTAQLHLPLLGPLFRKLYLARGIRMIGTMSGAGVSLVDCVQTAHDLTSNTLYQEMWQDVLLKIQAGKQMSEPLATSPLVPRSLAQMVQSGERSGKLSFVLEQIAGYSEQELKETIADLTRYIEPAMIVVMGAIIGSVAMALMLPIFSISKVIAK